MTLRAVARHHPCNEIATINYLIKQFLVVVLNGLLLFVVLMSSAARPDIAE